MKSVFLILVLGAMCLASAFAETSAISAQSNDTRSIVQQKLHPQGRKITKAEWLRRTGGPCEGVVKGGNYLFLDCTQGEPIDYKDTMRQMRLAFEIYTTIEKSKISTSPYAAAKEILQRRPKEVAVVTVIIDGESDGAFETIYPMDKISVINAGALRCDDMSKYSRRIRTLMWRAVVFTAGGAMPFGIDGCMKDIFSAKDIDALPCEQACPMSTQLVRANSEDFGFSKYRKGLYRTGCIQGWAPPPTNDYQRAVWEEVHAPPKNPMKIEFDPKKGR